MAAELQFQLSIRELERTTNDTMAMQLASNIYIHTCGRCMYIYTPVEGACIYTHLWKVHVYIIIICLIAFGQGHVLRSRKHPMQLLDTILL